LVCRIAKSSALAESILKKESHGLHFDKISQYLDTILDGIVKSLYLSFFVIPAEAGIQSFQAVLDSRLRGSDGKLGFQLTLQDSFGYSAAARHHIAFYEVIKIRP